MNNRVKFEEYQRRNVIPYIISVSVCWRRDTTVCPRPEECGIPWLLDWVSTVTGSNWSQSSAQCMDVAPRKVFACRQLTSASDLQITLQTLPIAHSRTSINSERVSSCRSQKSIKTQFIIIIIMTMLMMMMINLLNNVFRLLSSGTGISANKPSISKITTTTTEFQNEFVVQSK